MMKYRREMSAEKHLMVLADMGEIKVKGNKITVFVEEDEDMIPQVVRDYVKHFSRKGYEIFYHYEY